MKTIATFSKPEDAHLLRMRLEAGGIPAFVQDENIVQVNWLYSNAIGGIRVQVADTDAERAHELINALTEAGDAPMDEGAFAIPCPFCGSKETAREELARPLIYLSILLAAFPLPFLRPRFRCRSCGRSWKSNEGDA